MILIVIWIAVSLGAGVLYGYGWWRHDRAELRAQRRCDLAHAARELAGASKPCEVIGGARRGPELLEREGT
jgi:hypothetical protein